MPIQYISREHRDKFEPYFYGQRLVKGLELKSYRAWQAWSKDNYGYRLLHGIPSNPYVTYKGKGFQHTAGWLGYEYVPRLANNAALLSYDEARELVWDLNIQSAAEWKQWCKKNRNERVRAKIPAAPDIYYKDNGWINWSHWLGYEILGVIPRGSALPYEDAEELVWKLNLNSQKEWVKWRRENKQKRADARIPAGPENTYKGKGWVSYPQWLGYEHTDWLPFKKARHIVRKLKLRNKEEWEKWSKSGKRAEQNIPSNPQRVYKGKGWEGYGNWLHRPNKKRKPASPLIQMSKEKEKKPNKN